MGKIIKAAANNNEKRSLSLAAGQNKNRRDNRHL